MPSKRQLAVIHIAKAQLCLPDDEYRTILQSASPFKSVDPFNALRKPFNRRSAQPAHGPTGGKPPETDKNGPCSLCLRISVGHTNQALGHEAFQMVTHMRIQHDAVMLIENKFGEGAADNLVKRFGGQSISIPARPIPNVLADTVGPDIYEWLIEYRGGEQLDVPSMFRLTARRRLNFITDNPDMSLNALAAELGITQRRVSQIKADIALR